MTTSLALNATFSISYTWHHSYIFLFFSATGVQVSLSVMNDGVVSEENGTVPVLVTLTGQQEVYVTVTVETVEGSGL